MTFTLYIRSQPLGHTQLRPPAGHMLTPSLSQVYEVAEGGETFVPLLLTILLSGHKV